jgi:hypothetical protein
LVKRVHKTYESRGVQKTLQKEWNKKCDINNEEEDHAKRYLTGDFPRAAGDLPLAVAEKRQHRYI